MVQQLVLLSEERATHGTPRHVDGGGPVGFFFQDSNSHYPFLFPATYVTRNSQITKAVPNETGNMMSGLVATPWFQSSAADMQNHIVAKIESIHNVNTQMTFSAPSIRSAPPVPTRPR